MVSSDNIILAGIGILALGIFGSRIFGSNGNTALPQKSLESLFPKVEEEVKPENPQINILKDSISQVSSFIKNTFKTPPKRNDCGNPGQFSCGKINFTTFPKGSRFSINPFTGTRIALPPGPRGSSKTSNFFGGIQQLLANQNLVTQGGNLAKQSQDLLKDLQGQLKILETKSV